MVGRGDGQAESPTPGRPLSPGAQAGPAPVENRRVGTAAQRHPRTQRPRLGADVPCRQCGEPIYFNYRGPVEGVCGKCTDHLKGTVRSPGRPLGPIGAPRGSTAWLWIPFLVLVAFAAGALAGYFAHDFLPF